MDTILVNNPRTGAKLRELNATPLADVAQIYQTAQNQFIAWSQTTLEERARKFTHLKDHLIHRQDEIIRTVHDENGKPNFEVLMHELIPAVSLLSFLTAEGPKLLAEEEIPLHIMKHRKSTMIPGPMGVVLIISPWNFPFSIPFSAIAMAIFSGNSVVFKPSEITPLTGLLIQTLMEEVGFPKGLLQTVIADGRMGPALIDAKPAKIFFTGSVATGKKIMSQASSHLIPVNLELGGKDPMIVLSDANIDIATSAALWGGYFNNGQACASVERIIVHESISDSFVSSLKNKVSQLRYGKPESEDVGPTTMPRQMEVYQKHIEDAKLRKLDFILGGEMQNNPITLNPTIVMGNEIEDSDLFQEETFGPLVAITKFKTLDDAIKKANSSSYGLCASVFSENRSLANEVARKLEVGTVTVNEVAYTHGIAEVPWGGVKNSGFGKSHSKWGLHEFVQWKHIHEPRRGVPSAKSLWWFPYSDQQFKVFQSFLGTFSSSLIAKIKSSLDLAWNFVRFMKTEKRL